ncbi:MAG: hypothetical protein AAFY84_01795 [Pseudomonadota bacterium]
MRSSLLSAAAVATVLAVSGCASGPNVRQSDSPLYQSAYSVEDRLVATYNLNAIAEAPQRKVVMIHFDRPADDIFMPLLTEVDRYDETITDVSFDHSNSSNPGTFGVGSVRICTFESGKQLFEPLLVFEPGRFYAYTVDKERSTRSLPIKDIVLFYSFEDRLENSSLVTVRAHYNPPNPLVSPAINLAFGRALTGTFESAADTFGGRLIKPDA